MSEDRCACGCGRPLCSDPRRGMRKPCYSRWLAQGKPLRGPTPALSNAERLALARAAKAEKARLRAEAEASWEPCEPDEADLAWLAGRPERRFRSAVPLALALARCTSAGDAKGLHELRHRITDWDAVALVLARRAALAAAAPGQVSGHSERLTLVRPLSVESDAMEGAADAA